MNTNVTLMQHTGEIVDTKLKITGFEICSKSLVTNAQFWTLIYINLPNFQFNIAKTNHLSVL